MSLPQFTIEGRMHDILDEIQITSKFRSRQFVLEVMDGHYPEHILFKLVQEKTSLLDQFRHGDRVKVTFSLRGRGFNKNGQMLYFNNLEPSSLILL